MGEEKEGELEEGRGRERGYSKDIPCPVGVPGQPQPHAGAFPGAGEGGACSEQIS